MNTPPIGPDDDGSEKLEKCLSIAELTLPQVYDFPVGEKTTAATRDPVKSNGARMLLLTAQPESGSFVKYASVVAHIPAQTMADDNVGDAEQKIENLGGRRVKKLGFVGEESLGCMQTERDCIGVCSG
uniref:Uncharacterized protein LOC104244078 n=1 Tax=Nicotiana sylvestris TaxID=4096 RepID=A0A1U7Y0E9_NICSY|nr:PREDICTED: uncharacterized protein LOC104244078 [Nicotiana sylvestris]